MVIHQEVDFNCSASAIFEALTNPEQFATLTDSSAEIDAVIGGQFNCFGGMISGVTVEIVPNQQLIQAWRVGNWAEGIYSIVRFQLVDAGPSASRLIFDHTGFPEDRLEDLTQGWQERYWGPIKRYLNA